MIQNPGAAWSKDAHWPGGCGQNCGCCRAHNDEDWHSGCDACVDMWSCSWVDRKALQGVKAYDGVSSAGALPDGLSSGSGGGSGVATAELATYARVR
jgi:hypothetical protein